MPIDESLIIKLQADVTQYKKEMSSAAGVTAQAQKNIETSVNKITQGIRQSSGSFQGLGKNAGMAGIQLQQFFGQVQGGQSVLLALSQQATDLGFVLGAAGLGAAVGIAATGISFLIPLFKEAAADVEELKGRIEDLGESTVNTVNQIRFLANENEKAADKLAQDNEKIAESILKKQAELDKMTSAGTGLDTGQFAIPRSAEQNQERYAQTIIETRQELDALRATLDTNNQEIIRLTENTQKLTTAEDEFHRVMGLKQELYEADLDKFLSTLSNKREAEVQDTEATQDQLNRILQIKNDAYTEELDQFMSHLFATESEYKKHADRELAIAQQKEKMKQLIQLQGARNIIAGVRALNDAFLNENKAINAGLIIADTAAAAMAAYKTTGPAGAFAAIAFGAAQLAANNSASKGGGSISGGAGGGTAPTEQPTGQTTVEVSDIATNQTQVVRIELDGLDTFIEGVSKKIDEGKANGSL
jgi:hypothetical protein